MAGHPNAELLIAIANGKTIQQYVKDTNEWVNINNPLVALIDGYDLRIGESTITINGISVPHPEEKPLNNGDHYFIATISNIQLVERLTWAGDSFDMLLLKRGLVHRSPGNAEKHAIALISLTGKIK